MEAHPGLQNLTVREIEEIKVYVGFDQAMANALIPKSFHARGELVDKKLEEIVREKIDPFVVKHLHSGGHKTPREIFNKTLTGHGRTLNIGETLLPVIRKFFDEIESRKGFNLSGKEARSYGRQLNRTVTKLLVRTDITRTNGAHEDEANGTIGDEATNGNKEE